MISFLYVNDDSKLLEMCHCVFGEMVDFSVDTAPSANVALVKIKSRHYDAIVSDYQMPGMNGIEFLKELRARHGDLPFILFTEIGGESILVEAISHNAECCLQNAEEPRSHFNNLAHKVRQTVDRWRAEQAARKSRDTITALLNALSEPAMLVDTGRKILAINDSAATMYGDTITGLIGCNVDTLLPCELRELRVEKIQAVIASNQPVIYINEQSDRIRENHLYPVTNSHNTVSAVAIFSRDVTDAKKTDEDLLGMSQRIAEAKERLGGVEERKNKDQDFVGDEDRQFSVLFDQSPVGAAVLTLGLRFMRVNQSLCELTGYSAEELVSRTFSEITLSEHEVSDLVDFNRLLSGETNILTVENRYVRKDGQIVWAHSTIHLVRDSSERPLYFIPAIVDISHRKQAEDILKLTNFKLNLLFGITRHDILNKLLALSGYNEILKMKISDSEILDILEKQQKVSASIRNQIEFTKEYDSLGIKSPQWQKVSEVVFRAFSQILRTITFECTTGELEVYADPMMEKVFYNLFDNAFRYGEGISKITVSCTKDGVDLLLFFEDDGIGIPEDEKECIFRNGYGQNTGLGLYLTKEILSITRIGIRETGEYRKGARFEIRVPEGNYRVSMPQG